MPVPVWDCTDMGLLDEPLDTSTVVSVDVWKKFDLDYLPLEYSQASKFEDPFDDDDDEYRLPSIEGDQIMESCEIRHHDCMWAGLCISKEHNSTLATKIDPQIHRKVPAGRSLLIPKAEPIPQQQQQVHQMQHQQTQQKQQQQQQQQQMHQQQQQPPKCRTTKKNLESDGDSPRPETPQSSEESETESDYEPPIFRHDQISINERLSECLSEAAINAVPISVVTGQQLVRTLRKRIVSEYNVKEETTDVRYTLSDHCYHLKKLEHLGVQTPSDSGETGSSSDTEEEIDVVSYDKPSRQPIVLPTFPSPADQHQLQHTVKTAFKEKPSRPRGRPPLAANARKRAAAAASSPAVASPAKRPKRSKTYQKRSKYSDIDDIPILPTSGIKCIPPSRSSSDDEPDTEKRSLHNNMERQRRIDLRKAFEDLRLLVPAVERNEKAPKVSILRQAAAYCDKMTKEDQVYTIQVTELQSRQERLRARLSQLRKDFANSR